VGGFFPGWERRKSSNVIRKEKTKREGERGGEKLFHIGGKLGSSCRNTVNKPLNHHREQGGPGRKREGAIKRGGKKTKGMSWGPTRIQSEKKAKESKETPTDDIVA